MKFKIVDLNNYSKRLLTLLLVWGQVLPSTGLLASGKMEEDVNLLHRHSIYKAHVKTSDATACESFDAHEVQRSDAGIFRLVIDRKLLQDDLRLYLVNNHQSVGVVAYKDAVLQLVGFKGYDFQIEGLSEDGGTHPPITDFYAHVADNLTIKGDSFADSIWLKGHDVSLEGPQRYAKSMVFHDCEKCTLIGDITAPTTTVQAKQFAHQGILHCDDALLEIEEGEDTATSGIQATHDIILKGFQKYVHRGMFRAKRAILGEGDTLQNFAGSYTFAGLLHYFKGIHFRDNGWTLAWQSRIEACKALFEQDHDFRGHYLITNVSDSTNSVGNPIVSNINIMDGARIRSAFAIYMDSQNRLTQDGEIAIKADLFQLPIWEYHEGPGKPEQSPEATAPLRREIAGHRREFLKTFERFSGIYLKAQDILKVDQGNIKSENGSIHYQAGRFYFYGESQLSLQEGTQTLVQAINALCAGIIKSPTLLALDVSNRLNIPGWVKGGHVKIFSSLNESGRTQSVVVPKSGKVDSSIKTTVFADKTTIDGTVAGKVVHADSPIIKITGTGKVTGQKIAYIDAQRAFQNDGKVSSTDEVHLKLKADPDIGDVAARGRLTLEVPKLENTVGKLAGDDPTLNNCDGLRIITQEKITIDREIDTNPGFELVAPSVTVNKPVRSRKGVVGLEATQGKLDVKKPVTGKTVALAAPGGICEIGALISGDEGASISGQGVRFERKVKRTSTPEGYQEDLEDRVGAHTKRGNIAVVGQQWLRAMGAEFKASGGHLDMSSPDSYLGSQQTQTEATSSGRRNHHHHRGVTHHKTELEGDLGVSLTSKTSALHRGPPRSILEGVNADSSEGAIRVHSDGTLDNKSVHDTYEAKDQHASRRRGLLRKKKRTTTQNASSTVQPNKFRAAEGVSLGSKDDNRQWAPDIDTDGDAKITSQQGRTVMHTDKSSSFVATGSQSSSLLWQSQTNTGHSDETGFIARILAKDGVSVSGGRGVEVDVIGDSIDQALQEYLQAPETEWLKSLQDRSDTEWNLVSEEHDQWRKKTSGLAPPAAAIIAIGVSFLTAGAGNTFITPTIASMGLKGTIAATTLTAAANTAVSSLASTAAVSLISNKGDVGAVFRDLSSSQSLRSLATSIVTAGACAGLCEGLDISAGSATVSQPLPDRIQEALVRASTQAVANTTIDRAKLGDSLVQALRTGAANVAGGSLAHEVGLEYKGPESSLDYITHKIIHAAIGAGMGALSNNKALAGAIGATVGEIVAEAYLNGADSDAFDPSNLKRLEKAIEEGTALSQIAAATAAALMNQDHNTASTTAQNSVKESAFFIPMILHGAAAALTPDDAHDTERGELADHISEQRTEPPEQARLDQARLDYEQLKSKLSAFGISLYEQFGVEDAVQIVKTKTDEWATWFRDQYKEVAQADFSPSQIHSMIFRAFKNMVAAEIVDRIKPLLRGGNNSNMQDAEILQAGILSNAIRLSPPGIMPQDDRDAKIREKSIGHLANKISEAVNTAGENLKILSLFNPLLYSLTNHSDHSQTEFLSQNPASAVTYSPYGSDIGGANPNSEGFEADNNANRPRINSTPMAEPNTLSGKSETPIAPPYQSTEQGFPADQTLYPSSPGFLADENANRPSALYKEQPRFELDKQDIDRTSRHKTYGKFYRNKNDKLWYSKDNAKHGGSTWKVFQETGKGLEWEKDLDSTGKRMDNKHKSPKGKFIPKKELIPLGEGRR